VRARCPCVCAYVSRCSLREKALAEHYGQPVVGYFHPTSIISHDRATHAVDFSTVSTDELIRFTVPLR